MEVFAPQSGELPKVRLAVDEPWEHVESPRIHTFESGTGLSMRHDRGDDPVFYDKIARHDSAGEHELPLFDDEPTHEPFH